MLIKLKRIVVLFFLTGISVSSCKFLIGKYYRTNERFNFKSKMAYSGFLEKKKKFDLSYIIYPDSSSWFNFVDFISGNGLSEYYGCLLNDSTEVKKSDALGENLNCMGRVLAEIQTDVLKNSSPDSSLLVKSNFKNFHFRQFLTNNVFELNHSEKPLKIILIYSYSFGRVFDKLYDSINSFHTTHINETQLYIIVLDNIFHLK